MSEQSRGQISKEEFLALVKRINSLTPSPEERAAKVWNHLRNHGADFDTWDIVSFCSWFLSFSIPELPFLKSYAFILNKQVHAIHYQAGHEIGLYTLEEKENVLREEHIMRKESNSISRDNSEESLK